MNVNLAPPGVVTNVDGKIYPSPQETIVIHIDNADPQALPMELALEEGWQIYIYGPDDRIGEIREKMHEIQNDKPFSKLQGVVGDGDKTFL